MQLNKAQRISESFKPFYCVLYNGFDDISRLRSNILSEILNSPPWLKISLKPDKNLCFVRNGEVRVKNRLANKQPYTFFYSQSRIIY